MYKSICNNLSFFLSKKCLLQKINFVGFFNTLINAIMLEDLKKRKKFKSNQVFKAFQI